MNISAVEEFANTMRTKILDVSYACGKSVHLGGALSMVDIMATLYSAVLRYDPQNPLCESRDRFILSKGHGALGLYSALVVSGVITEEVYNTFQVNGSDLTAHPVMKLSYGIESSNGSLGQGLSMGIGRAIAAKRKQQSHKIYVYLGDGECNEGAIWEAAMCAAAKKLDNLIAIVDRNRFQNDGSEESVLPLGELANKWRSFGWQTCEVDGHCVKSVYKALTGAGTPQKPKVLVAATVKGRGVSFMENNNDWHHNRLTKARYDKAMIECRAMLHSEDVA